MEDKDIKSGQHFWALLSTGMSKELCVIMKNAKGDYYVCGGWECRVDFSEIQFIKFIDIPSGYEAIKLYYE